ncbi:MAG: hypothetical protein Q7J85_02550 [Bacillota bacterium]|nr:hypothetical protein [Bacillota bacterium]
MKKTRDWFFAGLVAGAIGGVGIFLLNFGCAAHWRYRRHICDQEPLYCNGGRRSSSICMSGCRMNMVTPLIKTRLSLPSSMTQ